MCCTNVKRFSGLSAKGNWTWLEMVNSRKEKNRKAILNSAATLMARNPRVSLAEIAKNAGVGRATLHRHFPHRDDLIKALTLLSIAETTEATKHLWYCSTGKEALKEAFKALIPFGDKYYFLSFESAALSDTDINKEYDKQLDDTMALVKSLRDEGHVADGVPLAWATSLIDTMIYTSWASVDAGHVTEEEAADLAFKTVLAGLSSQAHT